MTREINHDDRVANRLRQEFKMAKDSHAKHLVLRGYVNALRRHPSSSVLKADYEVVRAVYSWEVIE